MIVWPIEVGLLLIRPGMIQVLNGTIDDGWDGVLGWFWVACAVTTIVLAVRHPGRRCGSGPTRP